MLPQIIAIKRSNRTFMELKSKNFTFSELHGEF